jgi:hypothetical protein
MQQIERENAAGPDGPAADFVFRSCGTLLA